MISAGQILYELPTSRAERSEEAHETLFRLDLKRRAWTRLETRLATVQGEVPVVD